MGRVIHRAVRESGVPVVSVVEEHSVARTVRTALDAPETAGWPKFPVSILAVNADYKIVSDDIRRQALCRQGVPH